MKKAFILIILYIGLYQGAIAQNKASIPEPIKMELQKLIKKLEQPSAFNTEETRRRLSTFLEKAPSKASKLAALNFIKKETKSKLIIAQAENLIKAVESNQTDNIAYKLLKNAIIIDVNAKSAKKGDLLLKDDKIEKIAYAADIEVPKGAITYDLTGKYIIPGLIDNHVHITHGTLKEAQEHLEVALHNGVTGVRDMGGDGRMLALLKRNNQIGEYVGPDVFFSTIIAGPSFFANDPRPQQVALGAKAGAVPWQRAITETTDFKQIIAEVKGMGATAIKVYANVDKDLLKKVADEAKRQGLKVWAHAAIPPTRPSEVIAGGAGVISHAGDMIQYELIKEQKDRHDFKTREASQAYRKKLNSIPWDKDTPKVKQVFNDMKKNNCILDATLYVYTFRLDPQAIKDYEEKGTPLNAPRYIGGMKATKIAYDMGVKIGAGSDSLIDEDGRTINIHKELELLVKAGLSNIDALRAATIINAEGLGEEKNIGSIETGKLANLVILNGNPLDDISNTKNIKYVVKRGVIY
jgi:hypothetical protein